MRPISTLLSAARMAALLLPALAGSATGQSDRHRFDHLSPREGLSQDIVTAVIKDADGFMWFGTEDGLSRYDGYDMRSYRNDPADSTSLAGNSIASLFVDSRGTLWVSANGVGRYDAATDAFRVYRHEAADPSSLSDNHAPAICEDAQGAIWAATDRGLARLDLASGRWTRFHHDASDPASLRSDLVNSIVAANDGGLWVGTEGGLDRFDAATASFTHLPLRTRGEGATPVTVIVKAEQGRLWIGTRGFGVFEYDTARGVIRRLRHEPGRLNALGDDLVFSLALDAAGRIWIGHFAGLDIFDPVRGTFQHYSNDPNDAASLIGSRVYAIYPDRTGAMWLGTYHGGVARSDPHRQKFGLIGVELAGRRGIPDENVLSVLEDRRGRLWVGTPSGLVVSAGAFRGIPAATFSIPVGLRADGSGVLSLLEDRSGAVWIGRDRPGRLTRVDGAGTVLARYPMAGVRAMLQDRRGDLWFGTQTDGLTRLSTRTGRMTSFHNRPEARDSLWGEGVWSLFEDRRGILWIGTGGAQECLNRFDPVTARFEHVVHDPRDPRSLPGGSVRAMAEDSTGALWVGHWGGGLTRLDPLSGNMTTFTREEGFPSNYIKAIIPDARGDLWISTERGLVRFDPVRSSIRAFTTDDGLQGDRYYSGSSYRGRSGLLYFGGDHGLNYFDPMHLAEDTDPPNVLITSFKVFDRPHQLPDAVWKLDEIALTYQEDLISFEFVALDLSAPARNRYAYRMDGLQTDWVQAGTRRYASFAHLDPGAYTFRVKAANADGVWNNDGASIRIVIAPPFWDTLWFRLLSAVVAGAGLYWLYRIRIARLLAVERLRQRIAQDLHDDIGTNLSTIALASRSLGRDRGLGTEARTSLARITAVAQRTTDQMRDIVWVLKTGNDSLDHLVTKMREVAGQLLVGVRYQFVSPSEALLDKVDLEFKRNVFLFYKECLNNVARHAGAKNVTIRVALANGAFLLVVEDDGAGFRKNQAVTGAGLANLRTRAALLGGSVDISTAPGTGTKVVLTVKTTRTRHGFPRKSTVG